MQRMVCSMRRISDGSMPIWTWLLTMCLLIGCSVSAPDSALRKSGTFPDNMNLRTGKYQRHFLIHLPEGGGKDQPRPLVVVLHGAFSTAREMENWSGWSQLADREGFIVIYPEGIGLLGFLQHWNAGHCCGKAVEDDWDDVAFIEAAIDEVSIQYGVDKHRVFLVGFSNGGMMAYRFAAERPTRLAAVAAVAAAIGSRVAPDQPEWLLPSPDRPVPVLIMHGTADKNVPFEGGKVSAREYRPVSAAINFWTSANRCVGGPIQKDYFGGLVTEESWADTSGRNMVLAYRIRDWGHQWPGGTFTKNLPEHHNLKEFDAAQVIWRFFQLHSDRAAPAAAN